VDEVPGGDRMVRLRQKVAGVPVLGGDLIVAVNPAGGVVSVSAETPVSAPVTTTAAISAQTAAASAITAAVERLRLNAKDLTATKTELWLFDPRIVGAAGRAELRSTWAVSLGQVGRGDVASVLIDATDGTAALVISKQETAKNRLVCDLNNATGLDIQNDYRTYDCSDDAGGPTIARREGQAPVSSTEVNTAYDNLGAVYDFYQNNFGRDSIDGHGMPMAGTVRVCQLTCPYENAFWDGYQMVFGAGFASADDVVGHELTHGVTQHTSDLYYYSESGGINEAMSDIMGEFIDQTRGTDDDSQWNIGEDLPASVGIIRSMKSPTLYGVPEYQFGPNWTDWYNFQQDNYGVHGLGGPVEKAAYLFAQTGTVSFRGETITGIGIPKSAQIWYRLEFMLPSGAELFDVATLLPAACISLVGVKAITRADCQQVEAAVRATALNSFNGSKDVVDCAGGAAVTAPLVTEDFEHGTARWTLQSTNWQRIPSAALPVSWANSGKDALYSGTPAGASPGLAILKDPVVIPVSTYLSLATNVSTTVGGGSVLIDTGSGWTPLTSLVMGNGGTSNTRGYDLALYSLGAYAGQTARFALRPSSGAQLREWLVDDVRIYQCDPAFNGQPRSLTGTLTNSRTGADVVWAAPGYVSPTGVSSYEVSISPAIPSMATPLVVSPTTFSVALTGLDPAVNYTVFVRASGTSGFGPTARVFLGGDPFVDCHKYVFDPTLGRPLPPWPCPPLAP
jgi:Zn-dependent metalloprotease